MKEQKFLIRKRYRSFFGGSILGGRKEHQKDAKWLGNFKGDSEYKEEQEKLEITPEQIKKVLRKILNLESAWS